MSTPADFVPGWPLRHPHLQSFLASFGGRRWLRRSHAMVAASRSHVLDCGDGVRLMGLHSKQPEGALPKGLAVLIHGWEGSHDSAYLHSLACLLYGEGYNVFRLNLRDHGGTHHLNEELFHSARMGEVYGAWRAIERLDPTRPRAAIGFSLGGNFALRLGLRGPAHGIAPDLVISVCPSVNPAATLQALDDGPRVFHRYFIKKWRRTLNAKAAAWPGKYDFSEVAGIDRFTEITARFVAAYTEYGTLDRYFAQYTLGADEINASETPLLIMTAQDDPVVPFADFAGIAPGPRVRFAAPARGGHCGFIENLQLRNWAEARILESLRSL